MTFRNLASRGGEYGASHPMTDDEIVRRVLDGQNELFEVLVHRHGRRVYRAVRAMLHDESEVEDVTQQAFAAAFTHLAQFAGAARFSTWLVRISVNEAFARMRQRGRDATLESLEDPRGESRSPGSAAHDPERRVMAREMMAALERAVDALPETYRVVFMLREIEDLTTAEAALCLGLSEDNVKVRLHRARDMLRDELCARVGSAAVNAFRFDAPRSRRIVAALANRSGRGDAGR
jgi:RNA polymerase sigma-70 factor (ECF subfamily)